MALPSERELFECLRILSGAILESRLLAAQCLAAAGHEVMERPLRRIYALMDAMHNIPDLMTRWEQCDTSMLQRDLAAANAVKVGRIKGWWAPAFDLESGKWGTAGHSGRRASGRTRGRGKRNAGRGR